MQRRMLMTSTRRAILAILVSAPTMGCTLIGIGVGAASGTTRAVEASPTEWADVSPGDDVRWRMRDGTLIRGTVRSRVPSPVGDDGLIRVEQQDEFLGDTVTWVYGRRDVRHIARYDPSWTMLLGGAIGFLIDAAVVYYVLAEATDGAFFAFDECADPDC